MTTPSPVGGGAAFPQSEFSAYTNDRSGLTVRDWFAGQLAPSVFTAVNKSARIEAKLTASATAALAYEIADAMLAERAK